MCNYVSTYIYIDCLSLFTCSSYYSTREVIYSGVTAFIMLIVCSCNSVPLCFKTWMHVYIRSMVHDESV